MQKLTPDEIYKAGIKALLKELGPIGFVRFMHLYEKGSGDYTKERYKWLDSIKEEELDEFVSLDE